jgi:hypothetical protein
MEEYYQISDNDIELKIFREGNVFLFYFNDTDTNNKENELLIKVDSRKKKPFTLLATEDNNWNRKNPEFYSISDALLAAGVPEFNLQYPLDLANQAWSDITKSRRSSNLKFGKKKKKCKKNSKSKRCKSKRRNKELFLYEVASYSYYNRHKPTVYKRKSKRKSKRKKTN